MGVEKCSLTKKKKTFLGRLTNKFIGQPRSKRDQSVQTSLNVSTTSSQLTATVIVNSRLRQRSCSASGPTNTNNNNNNSSCNTITQTPSRHRRRSSLKTFIISHSPKPIPLIRQTRRRSIDLKKTPKRLSTECLHVALIRKIQPMNRFGSPLALSSQLDPTIKTTTSSSTNLISVTRQRHCNNFPNGSSPNSIYNHCDSLTYLNDFQHPSRYSFIVQQQQQQQPLFADETTSRDELFSIGPMKWSTPNRTIVYKTSSPYNNLDPQRRRLCTVDQLSFSNIFDGSD